MGRIWINTENGGCYFETKLKKFVPSNGIISTDKPNISGLLPNDNILLVDTDGVYEVDINSLRILCKRRFKSKFAKIEKNFHF